MLKSVFISVLNSKLILPVGLISTIYTEQLPVLILLLLFCCWYKGNSYTNSFRNSRDSMTLKERVTFLAAFLVSYSCTVILNSPIGASVKTKVRLSSWNSMKL